MNRILREEKNRFNGKTSKVAYLKKYILRRISSDGLVKHHENVSEHQTFDSEDEAFQFCADRKIEEVVILPVVEKDHFPD